MKNFKRVIIYNSIYTPHEHSINKIQDMHGIKGESNNKSLHKFSVFGMKYARQKYYFLPFFDG